MKRRAEVSIFMGGSEDQVLGGWKGSIDWGERLRVCGSNREIREKFGQNNTREKVSGRKIAIREQAIRGGELLVSECGRASNWVVGYRGVIKINNTVRNE